MSKYDAIFNGIKIKQKQRKKVEKKEVHDEDEPFLIQRDGYEEINSKFVRNYNLDQAINVNSIVEVSVNLEKQGLTEFTSLNPFNAQNRIMKLENVGMISVISMSYNFNQGISMLIIQGRLINETQVEHQN
jgi:hypothetical protein